MEHNRWINNNLHLVAINFEAYSNLTSFSLYLTGSKFVNLNNCDIIANIPLYIIGIYLYI